jgi:hydroxyethylthiazole kinase
LWKLTGENWSHVRGVDSTDSVSSAKTAAVALANCTGGAVAVSGETDLITDGEVIAYSHGGSHFLEKITGAGCSLGGVVGIYLTSAAPFIAALTATQIYNLAGARAQEKAAGPGSFQVCFLDELYNATAEDVAGNSFDLEEVL